MPVWTRLSSAAGSRYADLPLADAWIDRAVSLTSQTIEDGNNRGGSGSQQGATRAAWQAISNAFLALDLPPPDAGSYAGPVRAAYGGRFALGSSMSAMTGDNGTIGAIALRMYRGAHAGTIPDGGLVPVRMQLDRSARVISTCFTAGPTSEACPYDFPHEVSEDGARCIYYQGDWRCGAYDDPGIFDNRPSAAAPPLIYTFRLARSIASSMRSTGATAMANDALARRAGTITGTATSAPTQSVPDPPGWTRPSPQTAPATRTVSPISRPLPSTYTSTVQAAPSVAAPLPLRAPVQAAPSPATPLPLTPAPTLSSPRTIGPAPSAPTPTSPAVAPSAPRVPSSRWAPSATQAPSSPRAPSAPVAPLAPIAPLAPSAPSAPVAPSVPLPGNAVTAMPPWVLPAVLLAGIVAVGYATRESKRSRRTSRRTQ